MSDRVHFPFPWPSWSSSGGVFLEPHDPMRNYTPAEELQKGLPCGCSRTTARDATADVPPCEQKCPCVRFAPPKCSCGCSGCSSCQKTACGCGRTCSSCLGLCKTDPNALCTLLSPPHKAQLKWGLHPLASDALVAIGVTAAGISQTIGSAAASAGTHAQDGTYDGFAYSAATDLRTVGKTEAQIHTYLDNLAKAGFVAWYRKPGSDGWPSSEAPHIHAIWVGAKMKLSLRNQVHDFMAGKNGLASHTTYKFHTWSQCWRDALWKRFVKYNTLYAGLFSYGPWNNVLGTGIPVLAVDTQAPEDEKKPPKVARLGK